LKLPTKRMSEIPYIGIREIFEKAKKLEQKNKKIIHMEIGRPDFDTPMSIKKAAINALNAGLVHYTSNYGTDELRKAISRKLKEDNKVDIKPQEVLITVGAIEGLALSIFGLLDINDEVLIPSPCFPAYPNQVRLAGCIPVPVPLKMESNFKLNLTDLEESITPKTKMIIINSPHNPTGTVLENEDLQMIASFAIKHDLYVVADECYEKIIYGKEHISIASLPNMRERTIIINSTSKSFSMTGWRVGFVAANEQIIDSLVRVHQDITTCANSFAQAGAAFAYMSKADFTKDMLDKYIERRAIALHYLAQIAKMELNVPYGAFYVFPSIKKFNISSEEFCDYILNEAGVAIVPGNAFGKYGDGFVRISYSCSKQDVIEGMKRIVNACRHL
jgi:aspartate/methionine/tyrosine aminotransferase